MGVPADQAFDHHMMGIALAMAQRGIGTAAPNPSVGAVVVAPESGEVIARAVTAPGGRPHAEPLALELAGARARGATLYVTLEPCSHHGRTAPCCDAVIAAGIQRCVVAIEDPDPRVAGRGLDIMRRAGIDVTRGVRAEEAHWLTRGHIVRVTERRPFIQLKIAVDALGDVPRGAHGAATFATGPLARATGHLLRARSDAILVGHGTVRDDNPDLTCRLPGLAHRSPIRIVLASNAAGLETSRLAQSAGSVPVHVFLAAPPALAAAISDTERDAASRTALAAMGVAVTPLRTVAGRLWLPDVTEALAAAGVTRLLVEGGTRVWQSFARQGLYDEVVLFHARACADRPVGDDQARAVLRRVCGPEGLGRVARRRLASDDMFVFRAAHAPRRPATRLVSAAE